MPVALREYQYEIGPTSGEGGLVFGTEDTGYLTLTRPIHSGGDVTAGDAPRPYEDGIALGRDYRGAKSIAFEIGVLTDINNRGLANRPATAAAAHRSNLDAADLLEGVWFEPAYRDGPSAIAMMRACEAGVVSRAYGRPRRYEEVAGALTRQGYTPVVCDFQLIDNSWYADTESVMDLSVGAATDGALVAPLVAPLTTLREDSNAQTFISVGGSRPTWLMVQFIGPVTNPAVTINGITIGITGSLAYDQSVTIDPRPWARTVLRGPDNAPVAGLLSKATPTMSKMQVRPGTHRVQFAGASQQAGVRCRLRWRDARSRP